MKLNQLLHIFSNIPKFYRTVMVMTKVVEHFQRSCVKVPQGLLNKKRVINWQCFVEISIIKISTT